MLIPGFSDKPPAQEGFPMKKWNIELFVLDEAGNPKPATMFTKVTYNLHPSFEKPIQSESHCRDNLQATNLSQRSPRRLSVAKMRAGESLI